MKIEGIVFNDNNFTYVYTSDSVYTIARSTGKWGRRIAGKDSSYKMSDLEANKTVAIKSGAEFGAIELME